MFGSDDTARVLMELGITWLIGELNWRGGKCIELCLMETRSSALRCRSIILIKGNLLIGANLINWYNWRSFKSCSVNARIYMFQWFKYNQSITSHLLLKPISYPLDHSRPLYLISLRPVLSLYSDTNNPNRYAKITIVTRRQNSSYFYFRSPGWIDPLHYGR